MDRLWVFASVRDEEDLMPFFLRNHADWADRIVIQDCGSTDKTCEIVRSFGAELMQTEPWGMDEQRRLDEAYKFLELASGQTEWCACLDADEFILGDIDRASSEADALKCDVIFPITYTMSCDGLPKDDGRQIYEICDMGYRNGSGKPCIVRPGIHIEWGSGKHHIATTGTRVLASRINMLHYRWLGLEYTARRNAKNYANSTDKGTAWACADWYKGAHSTEWAGKMVGYGFHVMPEVIKSTNTADTRAYWRGAVAWIIGPDGTGITIA